MCGAASSTNSILNPLLRSEDDLCHGPGVVPGQELSVIDFLQSATTSYSSNVDAGQSQFTPLCVTVA